MRRTRWLLPLLLCLSLTVGCARTPAGPTPDRSEAASEEISGEKPETADARALRLGGNRQVGGRFLDADGYIYTSFHVRDPKTDIFTLAVTRRRPDGSEKQTILKDETLDCLIMEGGKLYGTGGRRLFRMNPDGSDVQILRGKNYEGAFLINLDVTEDAVFLLESDEINTLVRYNKEAREPVTLVENCAGFQRVGDRIYYLTGRPGEEKGTIGSIRTDGSDRQTLSEQKATQLLVAEDRIYYLTSEFSPGIWQMNLDGRNPKKRLNGNCREINRGGGYLYAVTSEGQNLCRLREDGSDSVAEALPLQNVSNIHIVDGRLYYVQWDEQSVWRADLDGTNAERLDP